MAAMRAVGDVHRPPSHAQVHEESTKYVIELDVSDFAEDELTVVAEGPRLTVRGDQLKSPGDSDEPFRLHESLEESFQLPEDADAGHVKVFWREGTLQFQVPRIRHESRRLPIERPHFLINPDAEAC